MATPAFNPRGLAPVDPRTGRPQPPAKVAPRPPPPPAPRHQWWGSSLADALSPTYRPPPAGQESVWDLPSAITHRLAPTAGDAALSVARSLIPADPWGALKKNPLDTDTPFARLLNQQLHPPPGAAAAGWRDLNEKFFGVSRQHPLGTDQNLLRTAVRDPGGTAITLGSLAAGGEGLAGDTALGRGLGAAKYVDPIQSTAALVGKGARTGARAVQAGLNLNRAFAPGEAALIKRNFPNLTDADLARPAFRKAMLGSFQRYGTTDAGARQGMLQFHGPNMPTPRGPITQRAPPGPGKNQPGPSPAEKVTDTAIASGKTQLAGQGDAMVGGSAPDPTAAGAAVRKTAPDSKANVNAAYQKGADLSGGVISGSPGSSSDFVGRLRANMTDALAKAGFDSKAMSTLSGLSATNEAAGNLLSVAKDYAGDWAAQPSGATTISFPDLEKVRRYQLGKGSPNMAAVDPTAATAMRNAWDQTVGDHIDAGHVAPDTPPEAGSVFADARAAHAQHQKTFVDPKTANPVIRKMVGAPDPADDSTFVGANDASAQNTLNSALFKGKGKNLEFHPNAQQTYNAVEALGPEAKAAMDDHIKKTILGSDNGLIADHPDTVDSLVNSPIGREVFSPDEASQTRFLTNGSRVLNSDYSLGQQGPGFWGGVASVARHVGAAGAASAAGLMLPEAARPYVLPALATAGGIAEDKFIEPWFAGRGTARQLAGASPQFNPATFAEGAMNAVDVGARAAGRVGGPGVAVAHNLPPPLVPAPAQQAEPEVTPYEDVPIDKPPAAALPPEQAPFDPRGLQPVEPGAPGETAPPAAGQPDSGYEDIPIDKPPRAEHAAGGLVVDLTEKLLKRAEGAQKAAQTSTKPLLGLSDTTVAQALRVAQRGL